MTASADEKIVFRKVSEAMNRDERYLALSPIPPCGRGLWHHLLFGPHITPLPGLSAVGRLAMAEELGWSPEAFDEAFREVLAQGLVKADWAARVVWLPNALKHNQPQSPNVVRSWKRPWERVPDCPLKVEAYDALKAGLKTIGEPYAKAFAEACAKPSGKAFGKPSTKPKPEAKPFAFDEASRKTIANQRAESRVDPSQEREALGEGRSLPRAHAREANADAGEGTDGGGWPQ